MIEEGIGLNAEQSTTQEVINSPTPVMTEDEYLASKGYRDSFYSEPVLHKGIQKQHASKKDYQASILKK